jgi:hypothetical protein
MTDFRRQRLKVLRQKASRNLFAASAQRRLEPACLSGKIIFDFFSIDYDKFLQEADIKGLTREMDTTYSDAGCGSTSRHSHSRRTAGGTPVCKSR